MFSVGSRITSSAIAVATQPPANSSRCSPSTLLGLLLSRENSTEPAGATSPVRKPSKLTQLRFRLSILSCCSIFA
ncbi:hypothetical protein R3I93_015184 [Phoxinus phoxinus]|uniref:Uncharacterized protein n=1 Tax=Phoxinus phoxinus TaxID=58324 RepID=A0AAN9CKH7_9TELE